MTIVRKMTEAERAKLKAQGLRPVEAWVRDWDDPAFLAEARRQAQIAAARGEEEDVMRWVEQVRGDDVWKDSSSLDDKPA